MGRAPLRDDLASSINFNVLRTYVRVVELGSMTSAAKSLFLAQSAVSTHVATLASFAGGVLLERHGGRYVPTELGTVLHAEACEILARLDGLDQRLKSARETTKERILVTCTQTVCETSVAKIVSQFAQAHPDLGLTITSGTLKDAEIYLRTGSCDVALVEGSADLSGAMTVPFHSDRLLLAMPPNHPLAKLDEIRFGNVADHPIILRTRPAGARILLEQRLGRRFEQLSIALELDGIAEIVSCVAAGIGTALLARGSIADALALQTIVARTILDIDLSRTFYAALPGDRPISPAASTFVEWLGARYASLPTELIGV